MSSQTLVDVNLQGMDRNFVPNGSYDVIGLGVMPLEQALLLLERMPRSYPPHVLALEEYCPAAIIFAHNDATVLIALDTDGSFYAIIDDESRGIENKDVADLDVESAKKIVREYLEGKEGIPSSLIATLNTRPTLYVYSDKINDIELRDIYRIIVKKPGFLSSPKIIIEYREPALNKPVRMEAIIRDKSSVNTIYNILLGVLGPDKVVLK